MKRPRIYFRQACLLVCLIVVQGCNKQLNQLPQTSLTDTNFWKTQQDLALACNYLYSFLPGLDVSGPTGMPGPYEDLYSSDASGLVANAVSNGSRLPTATSIEWTNYYRLVRAANNILEKSVTVQGDEAVIRKYLGEAHFFRAWAYFELVKRFGDVPYISRTLSLDDPLLFAGRTPRETVYDSLYSDLDYAALNCPKPDQQPAVEYGRITATAALAFKSRTALFEGTWNKYHGAGDADKHLLAAVAASDQLIASGAHSLYRYPSQPDSSYYYLFQYAGEGKANKENILVRLYGENQANNLASHSFIRSSLEIGAITPTKGLVDAFVYSDGLPQGKSAFDSSGMQTSSLTEFRNRDPRIGMTVFNKHDLYPSIFGLVYYSPGYQYRLKKYFVIADWLPNVSFVDYIVIRYAEVLLNNAEARFELQGSLSDDELNKTVNLLRARAGVAALSNQLVAQHALSMRDEIRRERRVELSFEGFRYWDLLRWKTAETELPVDILGPKYFPDEMASVPGIILNPDGFAIKERAATRAFNARRDYLWPLPVRELGLNANLGQNPEW